MQARRLDMLVDDAEIARRRAAWTPPASRYERGYAMLYQRHVTQADRGCDFDFLAAAVYVDDPGLLARFVHWVGTVAVPGGLARAEIRPAIDDLADRLADSPRTVALLRSDPVREACSGEGPA